MAGQFANTFLCHRVFGQAKGDDAMSKLIELSADPSAPRDPGGSDQRAGWEQAVSELKDMFDGFRGPFYAKLAEAIRMAESEGADLGANRLVGTFLDLSAAVRDLGAKES
jgi:hypothetical protein